MSVKVFLSSPQVNIPSVLFSFHDTPLIGDLVTFQNLQLTDELQKFFNEVKALELNSYGHITERAWSYDNENAEFVLDVLVELKPVRK